MMQAAEKIKVALYEDNNSLRDSMARLMGAYPEFSVTGAYPNAISILDDLEGQQPDVIVMDIGMPGISGIEAVTLVKKRYPGIRMLVQTVFEDNDNIFRAICAGADGYILKKTQPLEILDSIRDTSRGVAAISPCIAARILAMFRQQAAPVKNEQIRLSDREREILGHLTKGLSYKLIATTCCISLDTVRFHIRNIYDKLHVHSMTEAVSKALQEKLV